MMAKRRLMVCIAGVLLLACLGSCANISTEQAETFYNNNKDALNDFVELCFDNNIEYVGADSYAGTLPDTTVLYEMEGYYVYINNEISEDTKRELEDLLKILRNNNISNIYVDDKNHDHVLLVMSRGFSDTACIRYFSKHKSIEDIKKDFYAKEAWYIDTNWVVMGDFYD